MNYGNFYWIFMGFVALIAIIFFGDEVTETKNYWALWIALIISFYMASRRY